MTGGLSIKNSESFYFRVDTILSKTLLRFHPLLETFYSKGMISFADTELVHETLHDLLPGRVYYRFNPYLTEYLSLDETRAEKFQMMREATNMYLRRNESKVRDACNQLMLPRWPSDTISDWANHQYLKMSAYRTKP